MESTTAPAAGWFPDPGGSTSERWWSGDAWTEHTRQPLGDAVPAAFTALLGTLVEERTEQRDEPQDSAFAFAMTPTGGVPAGDAATPSAEPVHPGRHVVPEAAPSTQQPVDAVAGPAGPAPAKPPVPTALLERASAAPVMTVPVAEPAPSVALPTPPAPTPVATAAPGTASAAPALSLAGFVSPTSAPATPPEPAPAAAPEAAGAPSAPTFDAASLATPSLAEPVAPTPAAAEAAGFIMPNLGAQQFTNPDVPAPAGRHADAPAVVPEAPRLEVKPAAAPVGFTSSADPEVANRYRQVIHAPEPAADGPALGAPPAPALGGSPAQPGWSGMPLPSAGAAAPGYAPAPPGYAAAPGYAPTPSYAPAPDYAAPTGSNKAAKLALSSGISSLAALVLIFFGRILIVPSILSLVAIVAGIVGLVLARRAGVGKWSALGGLLMGLATSITLVVSLVLTVMSAFQLDTSIVEDDIVANAAPLYGVDIVSANCPDDVSMLTSTTFTCTAFDSMNSLYLVEVEVTSDGYLEWDLKI